jgi:MOSC domain-containing protein YiiM
VTDHLDAPALEAGLPDILASPADAGMVRLVVRRPRVNAREVLEEGVLDVEEGLVGDGWVKRRSRWGPPNPRKQLTVMNARVAALVARRPERWALAGDQLYVDLNLSEDNLPPGTLLAIGGAMIEVTPPPHTGCRKFVERFGLDAMHFVNSPEGRRLRLRGLNARVVSGGRVRAGDVVRKVEPSRQP